MKTSYVFIVYLLNVVVDGAWWVAAVQPIILGFGAVLTALNQDEQPLLDFNWNNLQIFKNDKDESKAEDYDPFNVVFDEPELEEGSWEAEFRKEK